MKCLSINCQLSRLYTNHSIRVTGATILNQCKFSASQIMSVTGHKSVSSLAIYQRVSDQEKLDMGQALSNAMAMGMGASTCGVQSRPPTSSTSRPRPSSTTTTTN